MDIVFMPSVRKCNICRKSNAVRQCGPGVSYKFVNLLNSATLLSIVSLATSSGTLVAIEKFIPTRELDMVSPLSPTLRVSPSPPSSRPRGNLYQKRIRNKTQLLKINWRLK